jgi:lipoate-protein ligase A
VVIGRNQNAFTECKFEKLRDEGGHLARRLSGGGAVFHDDGNLNFSFIATKSRYSVEKQLSVIIKALERFSVHAEKAGRNDIEADGRKFSGNAYFQKGDKHCHHGTLMVNVDKDHLSDYLCITADKLTGKGVASVRSRVVNLSELSPDITIENLKRAMIAAFSEIYGKATEIFAPEENTLAHLQERFSSDDWIFGKIKKFDVQVSNRFPWGGMEVCFAIDGAKIADAKIYADALDTEIFDKMANALIGINYSFVEIEKSLLPFDDPKARDIERLVKGCF